MVGERVGGGEGNERSGKPGTSKEHPRNMLATCLLLRDYYGEALARPAGRGLRPAHTTQLQGYFAPASCARRRRTVDLMVSPGAIGLPSP